VSRKQRQEDKTLNHGEQIAGHEPIQQNLPMRERAGEQEFHISRLTQQSSLKEPFKTRGEKHEQASPNQALRFDELTHNFMLSEVKQDTYQRHNRHSPDA
jgi:hypothetical protein